MGRLALFAPPPAAPSLPTVRAIERLWEEVAARPLYAPPRFFRYLKLRARMRLTLIDPARLHVVAPVGKVNDCSACTNLCCIGPKSTVLLTLRDLAALVDVGRTDLITHDKPTFAAAELATHPALARHTGSSAWAEFPVLAKNSFGACRALDTEGKCTLFPHWPLSCARFPYSLQPDAVEVVYSQRCEAFWIAPQAEAAQRAMAVQAVAAYNQRIKDQVLLAYARPALEALGLVRFLAPGS